MPPRALGPDDLILSHFSLRKADFDARVEAAAAAGFAGIGLLIQEYQRLRDEGRSDAELRAVLDRHGIALAEIEVVAPCAERGLGGERTDESVDVACHMAGVFGSRHLQCMGPYEGSLDDAGRAFARVCDRAAEVGLLVALECMPFNNISDAGVALEIVERAGRPNGGLCLDIWHHVRGASDERLLRAVPGERIVSVQLSDGTLAPEETDYIRDTLTNRRPLGAGDFDVQGFLQILRDAGADVPFSIEVMSRELAQLPPREAARILAESARKL